MSKYTFAVGLTILCIMVVLTLLILLAVNVVPIKSKDSISVNDIARVCVFSKTEIWCIYPDGNPLSNNE